MSEEDTHITKKRTTTLKIIVDEKIRKNESDRRSFLANIFDYPEYAQSALRKDKYCTRTVRGMPEKYQIYEEILQILQENNIDPSTFIGYSEEEKLVYPKWAWDIDRRVKDVVGMTDATYLHYKFSSYEESNGVLIHYLLFELETRGKTKTEIKATHKQNVCKLLNYLRMRKVPASYDCEWSFEGNRACQL